MFKHILLTTINSDTQAVQEVFSAQTSKVDRLYLKFTHGVSLHSPGLDRCAMQRYEAGRKSLVRIIDGSHSAQAA